MKKAFLLMLLLIVGVQKAQGQTNVSGTFKYPNGLGVNGTLIVQLTGTSVLNTCVTPNKIVPNGPVTVPLVNGTIQGTMNLVPSSCTSPITTYEMKVLDNLRTLLLDSQVYVQNDPVAGLNVGNLQFTKLGSGPLATILVSLPVITNSAVSQTITIAASTSLTINGPGSLIINAPCTGCADDEEEELTSVSYKPKSKNDTVALLMKAVKKQQQEIEELKKQIAELKNPPVLTADFHAEQETGSNRNH